MVFNEVLTLSRTVVCSTLVCSTVVCSTVVCGTVVCSTVVCQDSWCWFSVLFTNSTSDTDYSIQLSSPCCCSQEPLEMGDWLTIFGWCANWHVPGSRCLKRQSEDRNSFLWVPLGGERAVVNRPGRDQGGNMAPSVTQWQWSHRSEGRVAAHRKYIPSPHSHCPHWCLFKLSSDV